MKKKRQPQGKKSEKWDQVPIGEEFLTDKEFENLISMEVLTDYVMLDRNKSQAFKGNKWQAGNDCIKMETEDAPEMDVVEERVGMKAKSQLKKRKADCEGIQIEVDAVVLDKLTRTERSKPKNIPKIRKTEYISDTVCTVNNASTSSSSVRSTSPWIVTKVNECRPAIQEYKPTKGKAKSKGELDEANRKKLDEYNTREYNNEVNYLEEWMQLGTPDSVRSALNELGFEKPTQIQSLTIPAAILGKKDIVGAAETGSGKTLAFAIPVIQGIVTDRVNQENKNHSNLSALILTPTRELAVQIKDHIKSVAKYSDINVIILVGGLAAEKQERLLKCAPDIIVATPGRLWELTKEGNEYLSNLHQIRYLVIDETDRMVEKGHFQELEGILGVLNRDPEIQKRRQNFVFSATLSFTHEPPQRFKRGTVKKASKQPRKMSSKEKLDQIMQMIGFRENPKIVDVTSQKGTCKSLVEMQISCQLNQKDYYLYYFLLQHPGKTIVFSNSINCVRRLTNLFFHLKCETLPLHSEMHQKLRLRNLERFTASEKAILISTDVAARGLDIKNIQYVFHYQVPKTAESYIHRSGRTARLSKNGLSIILIEPSEITTFWNIFRSLGRDEMLPSFEVKEQTFRQLKTQVDLANSVETYEHMLRKKFADMNWMDKAKRDMDLASSDEGSDEDDPGKRKNVRKRMEEAKKELEISKRKLAELLA